jgi:type IV secretory pathway TrbD component
LEVLHIIFGVFKFIMGLGALATLLGIGVGLLWFVLHVLVRLGLRHQPSHRFPRLRQMFLESQGFPSG